MTKKEMSTLLAYQNATCTELHQVYGRYSKKKGNAFNQCRATQCEYGGYDGKIVSHNTWQFTYAFRYKNVDGSEWLHYETSKNMWDFKIEEC